MSGRSRVILAQAVGPPFVRFLGEMELQLLAQLRFLPAPLPPPRQPPKQPRHRPSSAAGFNNNPMARANASHFDCSLASCFRPAGVSR